MAEKGRVLNSITLEFLSIPENVGWCRVAVAAFASQIDYLTLNDLEEIKVAISEAVSNSLIHGYENAATGLVKLTATRYAEELQFIVADSGKGIADIVKATEAAYSTDPERMGLGFVFMKSFMDELEVISEPGQGTVVKMRKNVAVPPAQNDQ